jgi:hypothetical protein
MTNFQVRVYQTHAHEVAEFNAEQAPTCGIGTALENDQISGRFVRSDKAAVMMSSSNGRLFYGCKTPGIGIS